MAVTTKPDTPPDTECQARLRQAIADVEKQLARPRPAELAQAREDLDRKWVACAQELRQLARPLERRTPRLTATAPEDPDPARLQQLQAIDHAATLLERANHIRSQAAQTLFEAR